jgi:hypothetical protein
MTKLEELVMLMESFPSAFAQPNNGFMPEDILAVAAEIREKTGMGPKPETPPPPGMGAMPPSEWQYHGDCNGCGSPILMPKR